MKFKSHYKSLSFRVNGQRKKFNDGLYETENKDEIAVLETLRDVVAVVEKKPAPVKKAAPTAAAPKK